MEMPSISSVPQTVEDIFKGFSACRSAIVCALTSDVDEFYSLSDPVVVLQIEVASLVHDKVLDDTNTRPGIGSLNFVMGNKGLLYFFYWDSLPNMEELTSLNVTWAFILMEQHLLAAADRYA